MGEKESSNISYPFGVYFCKNCRTVIMWYPDTVKHPELNLFPKSIECPTCKALLRPKEKLWIDDIWSDSDGLVPTFLNVINKYPFTKAIICDEEHVHFIWEKSQLKREN